MPSGRKTQYQSPHEISVQITPASFSGVGGVVGVLPAGSIIETSHLLVLTAFNSTTNTIALGTTPGGAQILAATDLKTVARTDTVVAFPTCGPFGVDTPIYYTLAFTGGAPNVGLAGVIFDYLPGPG